MSLLGRDRPDLVPLELVSHGTRDQVSLLLRLALAEVLSDAGEEVPLLLDEPLLSADPQRRATALRFLWNLSATNQVVLSTSDPTLVEALEEVCDGEAPAVLTMPAATADHRDDRAGGEPGARPLGLQQSGDPGQPLELAGVLAEERDACRLHRSEPLEAAELAGVALSDGVELPASARRWSAGASRATRWPSRWLSQPARRSSSASADAVASAVRSRSEFGQRAVDDDAAQRHPVLAQP